MIREFAIHPSPDQLAALAIGNITKQERAVLLEHLAECELCRDCVSFVTEKEPAVSIPGKHHKPLRSLSFPQAAAIVALCLVGVYSNQKVSLTPQENRFPQITFTAPSETNVALGNLFSTVPLRAANTNWKVSLVSSRPSEKQIVVTSNYGERWLTFDSILTIDHTAESSGTAN